MGDPGSPDQSSSDVVGRFCAAPRKCAQLIQASACIRRPLALPIPVKGTTLWRRAAPSE